MKGPFFTFRGYSLLRSAKDLTPSMEDYLEMICRLAVLDGYTRVQDLADALNVKPPSVSRAVRRLSAGGYLQYEKYDIIRLTPTGCDIGRYLLARHETLESFFNLLGLQDTLLDAEKAEHNLSDAALERIACLVSFMSQNPNCKHAWDIHLKQSAGE